MTSPSNSSYAYGKSEYCTDAGYVLKVGDHLIVSRTFYTHHGIYAGDGHVIHYSGLSDGLKSGPVTYDTLETFSAGKKITVRHYSSPEYPGKDAVSRAELRLGESKYDVHSNNCEDFCAWAITGKHGSQQVEFVELVVGYISPVAALTAKARKHFSREDGDFSKNGGASTVAGAVASVALVAALPVAAPIVAVSAAYKWIFK